MCFQLQPFSRLMSSSFSVRSDRFICSLPSGLDVQHRRQRPCQIITLELHASASEPVRNLTGKPIEFTCHVVFDVPNLHSDDAIATRFEPRLPRVSIIG